MPKTKAKTEPYIVWSFDPDNDGTAYNGARGQVMVDVCLARSEKEACAKVYRKRSGYVTVDGAMTLAGYAAHIADLCKTPHAQLDKEFKAL